MRRLWIMGAALLAACGTSDDDDSGAPDASPDASISDAASRDATSAVDASEDAAVQADAGAGADAGDAATDASLSDAGFADASDADADASDAASCATPLLVGGTDVTAQGWTVNSQQPSTLTNGADYVELQTSTPAGGESGGQLLLSRAGVFAPGQAFKLQVVMQVVAVEPHDQFDSAAAIMGSLHGSVGTQTDRGEMIYLDSAAIGWSDDTEHYAVDVTDGAYHTYVLALDAAGNASVSIDGVTALTRTGYVSNGTIAVGDQTNDANVDSTLRIRSVTLLCP